MVIGGEEEQPKTPEGARPFDRDDILRGIQASERLLELGFSEAALLLAWPSLEATVRLLAREEDIVLTKVMKYRNALAHGFTTVNFDPALVKEFISTTKRLLQQAPLDELEAGNEAGTPTHCRTPEAGGEAQ